MSRETKQERIVRGMFDQASEHLHELNALAANPAIKELDIERWCQGVVKSCLGFTATNGYSILAQELRGRMRPDLVVSKNGSPIFVIEIKKLGFDLDKSDFRSGKVQLAEYLHSLGDVKWGVLCNGYEWRLYDFSNPAVTGLEVLRFDLRNDADELDLTKRGIEDACWNFLELHDSTFTSGGWVESAKEATAFSPESLARAMLSVDVVKYVARVIRGEHEYKANAEVLIDKIFHLLENGLNDAVYDWNETKLAELTKYIKAQKKAGRKRVRRSNSGEVENCSPGAVADLPQDVSSSVPQGSDAKKTS